MTVIYQMTVPGSWLTSRSKCVQLRGTAAIPERTTWRNKYGAGGISACSPAPRDSVSYAAAANPPGIFVVTGAALGPGSIRGLNQ